MIVLNPYGLDEVQMTIVVIYLWSMPCIINLLSDYKSTTEVAIDNPFHESLALALKL